MDNHRRLHYGIIGEGAEATITAYGAGVGIGVPDHEQKAWACSTCTFWNTESMGRFCSMCGSRRFFGASENSNPTKARTDGNWSTTGYEPEQSQPANCNSTTCDRFPADDVLQFSPIHAEKKKMSTMDHSLHDVPQSTPFDKSISVMDKSFSVMGLLNSSQEGLSAGNGISTTQVPQNQLNEKDFQMSFANWSVSDQGGWACQACTFVNTNPLHLQCEVCGQNRPSKTSQNATQRVIQDMMETSFRTGQHDFLRRQQEKIEEIEERFIIDERMQEIEEFQAEMLDESETQRSPQPSTLTIHERARRAETVLDDLERRQAEERVEQQRMEELLQQRRREAEASAKATSSHPNQRRPSLAAERIQLRAQERLLAQWQKSTNDQRTQIASIRERQQQVIDRWQSDF